MNDEGPSRLDGNVDTYSGTADTLKTRFTLQNYFYYIFSLRSATSGINQMFVKLARTKRGTKLRFYS